MVDVSIIIVNYNTEKILCNAIKSILEKTIYISYEIIIIDNNSCDNSQYTIERIKNKKIIYIKLSENIGFGRANNEGLKIAKGRNILFLNPDTLLVNNAVFILSEYLDKNPSCGVVGGNLYNIKMKPTNSHNKVFPSIFDEIDQVSKRFFSKLIYGRSTLFNYKNKPIEVGFICGADMMIPMRILNEVGGFCPDFFMYYEETELNYRIKKAGYKIINVPFAKIIHLEGKSFIQSESREYRSLISRKIYFNKIYSKYYIFVADKLYLYITFLSFIIASIFGISKYKKKLKQRYRLILKVSKENHVK